MKNDLELTQDYINHVRSVMGRSAWAYLSEKTGIEPSWFRKFHNGQIKGPTYSQIRRVLDFAESQDSSWLNKSTAA